MTSSPNRYKVSAYTLGIWARCGPLKSHFSIHNSPVRNDQPIETDLRRRQLDPREAGIFQIDDSQILNLTLLSKLSSLS